MGYIMGIDGGGTKTLLKIADDKGNLLAACQGGPSNLYSGGPDMVRDNLRQVIHDGLAQAQISMDDLSCVSLGIAGAGRKQENSILTNLLKGLGIRCGLIITHDAVAALYGALGKGEGIILVSGTGSICYGRKADGAFHRTGGWGHIIGDEGSGYDIGRRILAEVMRNYDGRGKETALTALVRNKLNLGSPEDLIPFVYDAGTGKSGIAAFGTLLDPACSAGDAAALRIARNAAQELFRCVKAVVETLQFPEDRIDLAMQGSVLGKGQYVKKELIGLLKDAYPMIRIQKPRNDAAWGAIWMAMERKSENK